MLGKLIKYEFRAVNKLLLLINGFTLLLTLIGCLTFASPLWDFDSDYIGGLAFSSLIVYYIAIIAISLFTCIYLAVRFYKNLYTDEGYLMHTLPVTPTQLIWSIAITAFCWTLITMLFICFSVVALISSAIIKFAGEDFWSVDFSSLFEIANNAIQELYGMSLMSFCLLLLFSVLVSVIHSIFMAYAAISVGQLFSKHKVLGSILCYIGFYFVMQIASMVLMIPYWTILFSANGMESADLSHYMNYAIFSGTGLCVVFGVIYYLITWQLMKKKLNLD